MRTLLAVCVAGGASVIAGCASDPELARYSGNPRVIGGYTQSEVAEGSRKVAGGALVAGFVVLRAFGEGLDLSDLDCGR